MGRKLTHEQYVTWVKENRPEYEVIEQYVNTTTKINHIHVPTGIEWKVTPDKFKSGVAPPALSRKSPLKRTHEQYVAWVEENRPEYEVIEQYINTKKKILHRHVPSNTFWVCSPEKFILGHVPAKLSKCPKWNHTKYKKYITEHNIPVKPIERFKTKTTRIAHKCTLTGNEFTIAPLCILNNPQFVYTDKVMNHEQYSNWLKANRPELLVMGEYITSHTKIPHQLKDTGEVWVVKPNNVIQGQRHRNKHSI